jgi:glycosyltransferase involved in cell wall biosynthesis
MIWLASYPRSGNTFLRNVLQRAYGVRSGTFHAETDYPVDEEYANYSIVKTHLLPGELVPNDCDIPAIYLVRDGRDCAVSLARYRQQLLDPTSDFEANLAEAIDAADGSYFGGWSKHVLQWTERASLVIRFEDLIRDPISCTEQFRPFLDLPEPDLDKLPTFEDLRCKDHLYGCGLEHGFSEEERRRWREGKFRKGRVGSWVDEMPHAFQIGFYARHGEQLKQMGYWSPANESSPGSNTQTAARVAAKTVAVVKGESADPQTNKRVLIDATKLMGHCDDGIGRYVRELLFALSSIPTGERGWDVDICFGKSNTFSLDEIRHDLQQQRLPKSKVPALLLGGEQNPVERSRKRLEKLVTEQEYGSASIELVKLVARRLGRSVLKRIATIESFIHPPQDNYDLIHLTLPNNFHEFRNYTSQFLTTVHDVSHLVCPELQTRSNSESLQNGLAFSEENRAHYLAVSDSTHNDLTKYMGIDSNRIETVLNAVSREWCLPVIHPVELSNLRERYNLPESPFLLSLGTIEPRKNIGTLIAAFENLLSQYPDLETHLVLAGAAGWECMREIKQKIDACPQVSYIGFVRDEDLPGLYSSARAVCYVSKYEGFGLPILEALACGTPAIFGDNSSMPEVAGDSGLAADCDDISSITSCMARILLDQDLHRSLSEKAIRRAMALDWRSAAEKTLRCYDWSLESSIGSDIEQQVVPRDDGQPGLESRNAA